MSNNTPCKPSMWKAVLNDGSIATAKSHSWSEVKGKVCGLSMDWQGVEYHLPPLMEAYECFNTGSCGLGGGNVVVESRSIGCRLACGARIIMRFQEDGSSMSLETGA